MPSSWQSCLIQIHRIGIRSYARVRPHTRIIRSPEAAPKPQAENPPAQPVLEHVREKVQEAAIPSQHNNELNPKKASAPGKPLLLKFPPSILYDFWDFQPPSTSDLHKARQFFDKNPTKILFTAPKLIDIPFTSIPEVAIIGRSNVGKSTLINAILQTKLAKTSGKAGKTKTMNAYDVGGKLTLIDMPGYGTASRREWGVEITKYLSKRKELKRVFVLIDAIDGPSEVKVKREDLTMLENLQQLQIPHQIVLAKVDRALFPKSMKPPLTPEKLALKQQNLEKIFGDIKQAIWGWGANQSTQPDTVEPFMPLGQLIAVTAETPRWVNLHDEKKGVLGLDILRWALLAAAGLAEATNKLGFKVRESATVDLGKTPVSKTGLRKQSSPGKVAVKAGKSGRSDFRS